MKKRTYSILCPMFPDVLTDDRLERPADAVRPEIVEDVWAEPFNDRDSWDVVREGCEVGSPSHHRRAKVFEHGDCRARSAYAAELDVRLYRKAEAEGWLHELCFLLYEDGFDTRDVDRLGDFAEIVFQCMPDGDGFSKNAAIAERQRAQR